MILVLGATGRQGGAVARHLLAGGVGVRALVRAPESAAGRALTQARVEVLSGDFEQPDSLGRAMAGVRGVFSVQPLMLGKRHLEVEWGRRVAEAARRAGVAHVVYSSVFGADAAPSVAHFASKRQIEQHIESIGLPYTILRPAGFMENLLMPIVRKGIAKGKLTAPNDVDAPQPLIAIDDIGAIAANAFAAPGDYLGRTIPLVGDVASTRVQAATLSRVLGREITPGKLPGIVTRLALGRDLYRMFRWNDRHASALPFSIETVRALHPRLLTFEDWCRQMLAR